MDIRDTLKNEGRGAVASTVTGPIGLTAGLISNPISTIGNVVGGKSLFGGSRDTSHDVNPAVTAHLQELRPLNEAVTNGKITVDEYFNQVASKIPQWRQEIQDYANQGQHAFQNMQRAGLDELQQMMSNFDIFKSARTVLGRDLDPREFAQAVPIFNGANGQQLGSAWLANLYQQDQQNPNSQANQNKVSGLGDQVNQSFQGLLGRDATAEEKQHFGSLLATGNLDPYQMQDFLKGTSEYQGQQNTKFQQGLGQQLNDVDVNYFNRAKQGVLSQFMQNGTGQSSALDSALVDLMGQIHDQDRTYLANVSANQYGGNQQLAIGNYQNQLNQYLNNQNYNRQNSMNQMNYLTGRSNDLTDYQTQMNDYTKFLNSQGNGRNNSLGNALLGATQGAIGGGIAGGLPGAIAGGVAGGAGGYLTSSRRGY